MSETYGEREGTYRMTNMVIQSQASWGAVERVEKGKRVIRLAPTCDRQRRTHGVADRSRCALRRQALVDPSLQSQPVLFPFTLTRPLAYVVSKCPI
jgi:protein subunit release factor B